MMENKLANGLVIFNCTLYNADIGKYKDFNQRSIVQIY
ncbi:hypothetical protein CLH_0616 [Clostridium botulinum E3 str. Alaska E43]|nr:hypothetical protein CLH_0616 [Clostridium botulinum E3 str. Alaska E43]